MPEQLPGIWLVGGSPQACHWGILPGQVGTTEDALEAAEPEADVSSQVA
jgi:hypothetical protein